MAAIDKIYGSTEQYDEFLEWVKANKPEAVKYFYPRDDYDSRNDRPICSFPVSIDSWLWDNCRIGFVQKRLHEQYSKKPEPNPLNLGGVHRGVWMCKEWHDIAVRRELRMRHGKNRKAFRIARKAYKNIPYTE